MAGRAKLRRAPSQVSPALRRPVTRGFHQSPSAASNVSRGTVARRCQSLDCCLEIPSSRSVGVCVVGSSDRTIGAPRPPGLPAAPFAFSRCRSSSPALRSARSRDPRKQNPPRREPAGDGGSFGQLEGFGNCQPSTYPVKSVIDGQRGDPGRLFRSLGCQLQRLGGAVELAELGAVVL